jgi:hypothetical protein
MTPEDRYHFEPLLMSVESAIGRGESVGSYHHSEILRLLRAALAAAEAAPLDVERLALALDHWNPIHSAPCFVQDDDAPCICGTSAVYEAALNLTGAERRTNERAALRSPDTETAGEAG